MIFTCMRCRALRLRGALAPPEIFETHMYVRFDRVVECVCGVSREVVCFYFAQIHALHAHVWGHLDLCLLSLCLKLMLRGVTAMMAYMCSVPRKYVLVSAAAPLPRDSQLQHD